MSSAGLFPKELLGKSNRPPVLPQALPVCGRDHGHFWGVSLFKTSFEYFRVPNRQCWEIFQAVLICLFCFVLLLSDTIWPEITNRSTPLG